LDTNGTDSGEDLPKETPQAPGSDDVLPNDPDPPAIPKHTPVTQPNKDTPSPSSSAASDVSAAARRVTGDKPAVKGLDDIIDLSKARTLPDKELTAIWRLRHANSPQNICAVIPAAAYRAMEDAARTSPQFVLPVPHESQGAEIHFLQWTFDAPSQTSTVLFTQLAEFKVRGEFAQPHTTITHHLDLLEERGLVMMQGQVMDGRGVSPEQARWLVMCLQRFYGGWESEVQASELTGERKQRADERRKLLDWFASGDERFTVEKLLEEAERVG
jgi:ATP synthase F1 complex assembly factor 1